MVLWRCQEKIGGWKKDILIENERGAQRFYLRILILDLLDEAKFLSLNKYYCHFSRCRRYSNE